MTVDTCSVAGCASPVKARGLCRAHYERVLDHGTTDLRRGPTGTGEVRRLLTLPAELDRAVRKAAAREGVKIAEWWRRAARDRLESGKGLFVKVAGGARLSPRERLEAERRGLLKANSSGRKGG